jgi:site-specific DNA recombinase
MQQRAELGKHLGGLPPLGYILDDDNNYTIDEKTAPIIRIIFKMYAEGCTLKEIVTYLNNAGYKTAKGKKFTKSSFNCILRNEKYIGIYNAMGVERTDVIPPVIDMDTWEKVQRKIEKNKHAPASSKGNVTFHLTGKLFCGKCNNNMIGDSGTGRNGTTHYYYSCIEKKRNHGCIKKNVKKDWLEELITDITVKQVLTDENIAYLADGAYKLHEESRKDISELIALQNTLKDVQKTIDNIMKAIEQGIITDTTKQRLFDAEERKKSLLVAIAQEEIKKPPIKKENIEFFLLDMRNRIYSVEDRIEMIIKTFVNSVYLYDDKLVITFNLKDGNELKKFTLTELDNYIDGFGFAKSTCTNFKWLKTLCFEPFIFLSQL